MEVLLGKVFNGLAKTYTPCVATKLFTHDTRFDTLPSKGYGLFDKKFFDDAIIKKFPSPDVLFNLAKLSKLAYKTPTVVVDRLYRYGMECSMTSILDFKDVGTQCFITWDDKNIVLSFRGTESLQDWCVDLKASMVPMKIGFGLVAKVHCGFSEALHLTTHSKAFNEITKQIKELCAAKPGRSIWVTGHSLGGALATIFVAKQFALNNKWFTDKLKGLYTFGAPRCGDAVFADSLANLTESGRYFRCVNDIDTVPCIPVESMGYRHGGIPVILTHRGEIKTITVNYSEETHEKHINVGYYPAKMLANMLLPPLLRVIADKLPVDGVEYHFMAKYIDAITNHC